MGIRRLKPLTHAMACHFCWLGATLGAVAELGCASTNTASSAQVGDSQDAGDLDPQRARVRLDALEPDCVTLPQREAESKPLSTRGQRRIAKAQRLFSEQRYTEASLELERALQTDPDNFGVHLKLARTLRAAGSLDRCRTHLQRALELGPDDPELHYLLAHSALDDGDDERAVCELRMALACPSLAQRPDLLALVHHRLAGVLAREKYLVAALEVYRRFERAVDGLSDEPDRDAELTTLLQITGGSSGRSRSAIHERLGEFGQAADALSQALEVQPSDTPDRRKLIELLSLAGRYEQAVQNAVALLALDSTAVDLLLDVHARAGHPQAALDDLAKLSAQHPDDVQHVLNHVTALERLGRPDQAQAKLERFAALHPERIALHWRLFDLYIARQAWGQAVTSAAQAMRQEASAAPTARAKLLELTQHDAEALLGALADRRAADAESAFLLGSLASHVGRHSQAQVQLERAVALAPQLRIARLELAALRLEQFRWSDALALLDALEPDPATGARVELLLGQAHRGLDQREEAVGHFKSAARLNPQDAEPLKALADIYERSGETLRAVRQYKAALKTDPLDEFSRESLFGIYFQSGDREEAAGQLHQLRARSASAHRIARCVGLLELDSSNPDWVGFRGTLQKVMDAVGPDVDSLTYVGKAYLDEADYDQALATLQQAVELAPNNSDALIALEFAYRMTLQFDQAAQTLGTLLGRHPNRREWIGALISVLVTDQQFDRALAIIRERLARDDLNDAGRVAYRNELLEVLGLARRFDQQIVALEGWLVAEPDEARLRTPLVQAYFAADKTADVLDRLEAWYDAAPSDSDLRNQLVAALLSTEQKQRACQVLLSALDDDPDNDGLQLLLVATLSDAGRHDDALELARNCLLGARRPVPYQWQMQVVYDAAGRHDDAVKLLGQMVEEAGDSDDRAGPLSIDYLREMQAEHLIRAKRYNDAQVKLTRWIERSTDSDVKFAYLRRLSQCRTQRGQPEQALEALEQAYDLKPTDARINNDLAYGWADTGINLDEAEKRLRYAVAQRPRVDAYLDSLGWVLYKKGRFVEAAKWLSRSLGAGSGDDPVILNHLGDTMWRTGRREEAGEHWAQARQQAQERLQDDAGLDEIEYQRVLDSTRQKIEQLSDGQAPQVAPLGKNINLEEAASQARADRRPEV